MPIGLKVKADDAGVMRLLTRLRSSFDDMREPLSKSAERLTKHAYRRFETKRNPDGSAWAPWSPRTANAAKGNPNRSLMVKTGELRKKTRFIAGRRDLRAVIGTPYGAFHEQANGPGKGRRLPRRAFLFSTRNGNRALAEEDEKYLLNSLRYQIRKAAGK